jgi:hypothetical protein
MRNHTGKVPRPKRARPTAGVIELGEALPNEDPREEQSKHPQHDFEGDFLSAQHGLS